MTFEEILKRMLDRVPDTLDKREGSIIYDAIAPVAAELVQAYIELENTLDLVFVNTSSGEYLTKLCSQFGVNRLPPTKAIRKGYFKYSDGQPFNVLLKSRYTIETIAYTVTSRITDGVYELECEIPGITGNTPMGKMIPVEYTEGLGSCEIREILIPGENEETDEQLKERYFEYISEPSFGGNVADYRRKVEEISGVGAVKVYPVWNGEGTVKLVLLTSEYDIPSYELIKVVQKVVSPDDNDAGVGIAPIGHTVTIVGANGLRIDVGMIISLMPGYLVESITAEIQKVIEGYIDELKNEWKKSDTLIVRIAHIESRVLNVKGVLDIADTTLNNQRENITISSQSIPVLGEVVVTNG